MIFTLNKKRLSNLACLTPKIFKFSWVSLILSLSSLTLPLENIAAQTVVKQTNVSKKCRFTGHFAPVTAVAISPDGKILASGSADRSIKLSNMVSGREINALQGHTEVISRLAISPDSKTIISGDATGVIKLWDISTGKLLRTLQEHTSGIRAFAISRDSKTLVSGGQDNTIVWDISTGKRIYTLRGDSSDSESLAISSDGKNIINISSSNTVKFGIFALERKHI
ncbi:MAG: hypothetical protein HC908_00365 [Calothrix sp. SM1_7_51]|nr:hypothetical protein [Calothrix sp. SM1_7_51]